MIENSTSFQNMFLLFIKYVHLITIQRNIDFFQGYMSNQYLYIAKTLYGSSNSIQLYEKQVIHNWMNALKWHFPMFVVFDLRKKQIDKQIQKWKSDAKLQTICDSGIGHIYVFSLMFVLLFFIGFILSATHASISDYTCVPCFSCSCNQYVLFWWNELLKIQNELNEWWII